MSASFGRLLASLGFPSVILSASLSRYHRALILPSSEDVLVIASCPAQNVAAVDREEWAVSVLSATVLASAASHDYLGDAANWALIVGAALALSSIWVFQRSGPRLKVRADVDDGNVIRVIITNTGRLRLTVTSIFLGTLRRRRTKRRFKRLPDAEELSPSIDIIGPDLPDYLEPGDVYVCYAVWPQTPPEARKEWLLTEKRVTTHTVRSPLRKLTPGRTYAQVIVALNDRCIGAKMRSWPIGHFVTPDRSPAQGDPAA